MVIVSLRLTWDTQDPVSKVVEKVKNLIDEGLERSLSRWDHVLLLQKTQAQFPAPTWRLAIICNSSFQCSGALLTSVCTNTYIQSKHSVFFFFQGKKKFKWINEIYQLTIYVSPSYLFSSALYLILLVRPVKFILPMASIEARLHYIRPEEKWESQREAGE